MPHDARKPGNGLGTPQPVEISMNAENDTFVANSQHPHLSITWTRKENIGIQGIRHKDIFGCQASLHRLNNEFVFD